MQRFLIFAGFAAFSALYLLALSTNHQSQLGDYFWHIVIGCAVLGALMFGVMTRYLWLLYQDHRRGVFGSRIARRLSVMFAVVAALPTVFLLGVAAQFISYSINSWFGDDTREALERSLQLSKSALNAEVRQSVSQALLIRANAQALAIQNSDLEPAFHTEQARRFTQLAVWSLPDRTRLAESNPRILPQPVLDTAALQTLRANGQLQNVEGINGVLYVSGWLMMPSADRQYALFFRQPVPKNVAEDAELIDTARTKYATVVHAQQGLQTFFLITLLVAALLAVLIALAAALHFSRRFVAPIVLLADGARAVADGNFPRHDELGELTRLFNHMTEELSAAKDADELHRAEQDTARRYVERVLENLSAGVITLDGSGRIHTYNRSAETILAVPLAGLVGQLPQQWARLSPQHTLLAQAFFAMRATEQDEGPSEIDYAGGDESRTLLGKAIPLPAENGKGVILVFDDITLLSRAQKDAAWGEVARRLAHEIKNPLTPIQLSAERLAWKLGKKLDGADAKVLEKSTDTIIKQVAALKEMVEAFRNYARAPSLKLAQIDLNTLVSEILVLYESSSCRFIAALCQEPLPINADATAMRQVLHNLFKNAAEAAQSDRQPEIRVRTRREEQKAVLIVSNNGKPFSQEMLQNAFVPYATDKPTGTGLGLSVVKKIIDEHGGHIGIANRKTGGARIGITLPLITTPEKKPL